MKARKKPVVIDYFHYEKGMESETAVWPVWLLRAITEGTVMVTSNNQTYIETLEGRMLVSDDDYILKGVNGELYPCKPDIFAKCYDIID